MMELGSKNYFICICIYIYKCILYIYIYIYTHIEMAFEVLFNSILALQVDPPGYKHPIMKSVNVAVHLSDRLLRMAEARLYR